MDEIFKTPECLEAAALERYLDGALEPAERDRSAAHILACARCQSEIELLGRFTLAQPDAAEAADVAWITNQLRSKAPAPAPAPSPAPLRASWWHSLHAWPRWAISVAGLLVIVAGALQLRTLREPGIDASGNLGVVRSGTVALKSPLGDLTEAPTTFSWNAVAGAATYHIVLSEVDGTELWSATTPATSVTAPPEAAQSFVPRKTLLWKVTALSPSGERLAASPAERFRLVPGTQTATP